MNLEGVVNTHRSEAYFWEVCGTISIIIIGLAAIIAFKRQITTRLNRIDPKDYVVGL